MLYSQMTPEQRKTVLDDPERYPLRVTFLGKVAILTEDQVAFLMENGIDFDVDDRQVAEVLDVDVVRTAAFRRSIAAEEPAARRSLASQAHAVQRVRNRMGGCILYLALNAAMAISTIILRRLTRR